MFVSHINIYMFVCSRLKVMPAGGDNLPRNFSWLVPGQIAGCAAPQSELELRGLVEIGITHLVTLSTDAPPPVSIAGMRDLRNTVIPAKEFRGPQVTELIKWSKVVIKELNVGGKLAVH